MKRKFDKLSLIDWVKGKKKCFLTLLQIDEDNAIEVTYITLMFLLVYYRCHRRRQMQIHSLFSMEKFHGGNKVANFLFFQKFSFLKISFHKETKQCLIVYYILLSLLISFRKDIFFFKIKKTHYCLNFKLFFLILNTFKFQINIYSHNLLFMQQ